MRSHPSGGRLQRGIVDWLAWAAKSVGGALPVDSVLHSCGLPRQLVRNLRNLLGDILR